MAHKGLGDSVEALLNLPGIKNVVQAVVPEDCGCKKRKEALNKWLPYTQE